MKKTSNTSQLGTGMPTSLAEKGNISMPMNLQMATKILERAIKTPTSRAVNAVKAGIREIENLARDLRNARLRLLLSKVHALGLPGAPEYERAYAYVLAAWATESGGLDAKFELGEEQQYWEVTLTDKQQDRAAELLPNLLADGEPHKHVQGNPFNGSWWGYEDDPVPAWPGSPEFRRAYDKWLTAMRIEPRPDSSLVKRPPQITCKVFKWSDNWETESVVCPRCGWQGAIEMDWDGTFETGYDDMDRIFYFRCPKCPRLVRLASITLASAEEAREHWDDLSAEEKGFYAKRIERETKRIERDAKTTNDFLESLPEIAADPLILVWDIESEGGSESAMDSYTTIKHEGRVIWREPARWECVPRFNAVANLLRQKYGDRLKALIPTSTSTTNLFGDILSPVKLDISTSYPILGIEALAQAGDQNVLNRLRYEREFAAHRLEQADQLPEVSGDFIVLSWDLAESPPRVSVQVCEDGFAYEWDKDSGDGFLYITLRHEAHELWREAAATGSDFGDDGELRSDLADRYGELAAIAKSKYGTRLKDLVPSLRSAAYYGGALVGKALKKIRSRCFPKSEDAVLDLWRNAVAGYPDAQNEVSELLFIGGAVTQDSTRAAYWCRQAADQGNAFAQCSVGILYEHGDGVPQDYAEAMKWYRKAADQGDSAAQSNLGTLYANGNGVSQNYAEAVKWYRKAADQDDAGAQCNLGAMYESGQGVSQDYVQAHIWFSVAAAGYPESLTEERAKALNNRDTVAAKMTPAQITEAQRLARARKSN